MKSKTINKLIFAAGIAAVLIFSGCSVKKHKEKPEEISFSWWGKDVRHEYTLKGLEHFHELYPEITVTPEYDEWTGYEDKFDKLYKENKTADVMQINFDWLYKYSSDGNGFYDLNQLDNIIELPNFINSELEYGKMNKKLNALPTAFNAIIPVYNKALYSKYGLKIPETWDDVFTSARVMRKDGYYILALNKKSLFLLECAWFEQTHGRPVFKNNFICDLSEDEAGEMIAFFKKCINEKVIYPEILSYSGDEIVANKISSAICWCSESSKVAEGIEKQGGQAFLGNFISTPGATSSGWYLKPATMYAIKKDCPHPEKAAILVNYLLNNRDMALIQKCEKGIPVSNKSLTALMEERQLAEMEYQGLMKIRFNKGNLNKMVPVMENKDIVNCFYDSCAAYNSGKSSLKETASNFCSDVNKVLVSLK